MSESNVFERIIRREIPATVVWEDDETLVFKDIAPQAPVHLLVIPKRTFERLALVPETEGKLLGRLLLAAQSAAREVGIDQSGYRIVINNGSDAGEAVPHLHLHLLGGRKLEWPPG
ncbi:MAG: histidine triad nucleotide-binding protein [Candidatus Methylacidiphilales bacterium]